MQGFLLAEVALEQTLKGLAVAGLVAGHLVHGVMDRVEIVLLGQLCELELAVGRAVLGIDAHLEVLLRAVGDDLAEELGELRGVLGFLVGGLLPVQADLRVALAAVSYTHLTLPTTPYV